MKIYGIPNCGSVKKALDFVKTKNIEFEFVDFKKTKPTVKQIEMWAKAVSMDKLFNTKGTKYRSSGLDYKSMSETERVSALVTEPTMLKRPLIEYDGGVVVGYDEDTYSAKFKA